MTILSILSFIASILYFHVGLSVIKTNSKSKLCKLFFLISLSMVIWSFAGGFLYLAENHYEYSFWNKISAFGWCSFGALIMYFTLVLIENKQIRNGYIKLLVLIPAPIFLFIVLFLFGPDINTNPIIENIFYTGNFLYNFSYLAVSMFLIFQWGHKSDSKLQKKQSQIIVICSLIPFLLNLLFEKVLPYFGLMRLPNMGQIFTLIMLWGVYYASIKYQFMSISNTMITNNLFNELTGLTMITDMKGHIIKVNKYVNTILDYTENEIIGRTAIDIIKNQEFSKAMKDCEDIHELSRAYDINVPNKSGFMLPFDFTIIPLYSKSDLLLGYLIIGEDIRANKGLQEEIVSHMHTIEKLRNSEMLFRTLFEVTPVSIILASKSTHQIKYLNKRAEELLCADKEDLIGSDISDYVLDDRAKELYTNSINSNSTEVIEIESLFKRKDNSQFIGLITMVSTMFNEEEVTFFCVIDMTEQKKTEEMLKLNNENIANLNNELVNMNSILANKSVKDSLTNLFNHQYMNEILEAKLQDITKTNENLCVMMLDIDYFKDVNDRFGHLFGDKVLVTIAELILASSRGHDYVGRYGGEEFIVVLPNTDLQEASLIAENIRKSICDQDFSLKDLKVTISVGVVQYSGEVSHVLINKADILLYRAKDKGRNRVENGL